MPTAHKVLVKAGESALGRTSAAATATAVVSTSASDGRWSEYEHELFLQGLEQHGKKWEKIAAVVETRTERQIKSHAQKYFAKLERLQTKEMDELMTFGVGWDERFQQLVEFKEQNGHCRVPKKYEANTQLGNWVDNQRTAYKKNKLLPEQIKSLEGIGFVWLLKKLEIVGWDERFKQLKEYKEQNGHCRVPKRYKANTQLGSWVRTQRHLCKKNKLLPEQKDRLEGIGFEWELRKHLGWDERFQQLVEYKEQNGHCRVPQEYKVNPQLGVWVKDQRYLYKKKNKLLPEQIKSLEGIGFAWVLKKHEIVGLDERFKQLKEYKEKNGHCLVPQEYKVNPQLGVWVKNQRLAYRKQSGRKITEEQIRSLEGIGFVWKPPRGGYRS